MKALFAPLLNRTPVAYAPRSAGVSWPWSERSDATAQIKAMGSVGTLFNIVSTTSQAVSEVEWKLWRKAKSGKAEDRTEVTSHAALDLWNHPNPFMTGQEYREVVQQHLDLTGEGWGVVARNAKLRSIPLELWPVRPDRMAPVPSATDYIVGYVYTSPDGERVPFETDSVLFMRMPNPDDAYRGMGPVQSVLMDLDSSRYSAQWNRNFFLNSAEPGGVIEVDRQLSDDEFNRLVEQWSEQHRGVANAHRVAVLEQAKWVSRQMTMKDMQFVELRSVSKEVIREAFGFPKFAAGEVDDVNRATADASSVWFAKRLTVPRLSRWKGMANNDLLPLFGTTAQNLEFDYESPVTEDEEAENAERGSKATAAKTYIDAGFTAESVVEALELPDKLVWEKPEPPAPPPPPPGMPAAEPDAKPAEDAIPAKTVAALLSMVVEARARDEDRHDHDRPFRRQYYD